MKSEFGARPIDFEPTPHYRAFSASLGWKVPHFRGSAANSTAPVATTQLAFGGGGQLLTAAHLLLISIWLQMRLLMGSD